MIEELEAASSPVDGADEPSAFIETVVETLVNRGVAAQRRIESWSEDQVDRLLQRLARVVADNAHLLAAATVAETGMGNVRDGIKVCRAVLDVEGIGHTAIIHTRSTAESKRFATAMPVSRVLVNTPATQGLMGLTTGLLLSMTLGCGTWGGTSTTNNVSYRDLMNIKRVAYHAPKPRR
jgi:acyl-CoA reductase-like NAD-dependent aldehyde dehydrogenase